MTKLITSFLLIALACSQAYAQPLEFKGDPAFGRLYDVTFDPVVPNRVYALSLGNHVLQSSDKGVTWQVLYAFPNNDAFLKKMVVRPDNTLSFIVDYTQSVDGVYILDIGTGSISHSYMLPIPDGATKHWVQSYSIQPNNSNFAIMHQSYMIGFAGYAKVYYTSDGGTNWTEVYFTSNNNDVFPNDVAISPVDPNQVYIARGAGFYEESGGLLVSQDAGSTWELKLPQINMHKIAIHPTDPATLYMGTGHGDHPQFLYKSTDYGQNWDVVNTTWTDGGQQSFSGIAFNAANPANMIVMDGNEVAITNDSGTTWAHHVYPDDDTSTYSYGTSASFNPYDANEVFVGADWKPMFSTDGGATLTQVLTPFFSAGLAAVYDGDSRHLYYGVQSGFVHVDLQTEVATGYEIQPVDVMTNYDQPTYLTDPNHEGRVYEYHDSMMGATLYVSDDHGQSKTDVFQTFFDTPIAVAASATNPNIIWASLASGVFLIDMTDAQNIQQTPVFLPEANYVTSILPGSEQGHVIMGVGHRIYQSFDFGQNWSAMDNGLALGEGHFIWDINRNPFNANEMLAASTGGIFRSADNGENWSYVYSGNNVRKARFSNKTNGHVIATQHTSYVSMAQLAYSLDGGLEWTEIPPSVIANSGSLSMDFLFNPDNADIYVSTFDLGLLKLNLQLEVLSTPGFGHNEGIALYPNPATDRVNIAMSGQNINKVSLYDAAGKRVLNSVNSQNIDISVLAPGIYFVRAQTDENRIYISKLVKS